MEAGRAAWLPCFAGLHCLVSLTDLTAVDAETGEMEI